MAGRHVFLHPGQKGTEGPVLWVLQQRCPRKTEKKTKTTDKISKGYRKNWAGGFRKSTRSIPCLARSVGGSYGSPPYAKRLISIPPLIPSILRIRGIHYQFSRLFSSYPHSGYPNTPEISSILADMLCILLLFGPADFHVT
jgi:hypothetical protein